MKEDIQLLTRLNSSSLTEKKIREYLQASVQQETLVKTRKSILTRETVHLLYLVYHQVTGVKKILM